MRKGLKITFWGLGTVVVLLMARVFVGPTIFGLILVPDHRFGDKPLPDAPDYSLVGLAGRCKSGRTTTRRRTNHTTRGDQVLA